MSREVWISKPHATRLRSQASSCDCKHTCIIENANGVPLARWHGTSPHQNNKTNRQWTPRHLFYFLWVYIFILRCVIECPLWACRKFPSWMMHGLDYRPRRFSNTYTNSISSQVSNLFHIAGIHKQKITISTKWEKVQCWKLAPWRYGWANFQLITCKHNINIREPQWSKLLKA
jgi:hypothetical protein